MRHGELAEAVFGPLVACAPECDAVCVCDGGDPCEHDAYSFFDDGEQYCVECYAVLNDDDESDAA